eukprot:139904_1
MKLEVLNSEKAKISLIEYNNTFIKANTKYNALKKNIKAPNRNWLKVYEIPKNSSIQLKHILCIMFYTNFTNLQNELTKTYRKLSSKESDESIKQRHSKYGHWGRYLRETIDLFGTTFQYAKSDMFKQFYHGLSCKMKFDGFKKRFYGPTSTTLREEI